MSCLSAGVPGAEGLSGPHADARPAGASERHRPPGAPLPPAGQLSAVPGAPSGAVPQAHVPLLKSPPSTRRLRSEKEPEKQWLFRPARVESTQSRTERAVLGDMNSHSHFLPPEDVRSVLKRQWIRAEVHLTENATGFYCVLCEAAHFQCYLRPQKPGTTEFFTHPSRLCSFIRYFGWIYTDFDLTVGFYSCIKHGSIC